MGVRISCRERPMKLPENGCQQQPSATLGNTGSKCLLHPGAANGEKNTPPPSHVSAMLNSNNMKHRQKKKSGGKWLMESINHVGIINLTVGENGDFFNP